MLLTFLLTPTSFFQPEFGYREALWKGYNDLKNQPVLTTNLFIELVQTIKEHSGGIREGLGTATN